MAVAATKKVVISSRACTYRVKKPTQMWIRKQSTNFWSYLKDLDDNLVEEDMHVSLADKSLIVKFETM